jgi:3-hydroxybutyryl-CoA dehydrogenase
MRRSLASHSRRRLPQATAAGLWERGVPAPQERRRTASRQLGYSPAECENDEAYEDECDEELPRHVSTGRGGGRVSSIVSIALVIRRVGVVGLGTMGAGIAQVAVQSGHETVGREVSEELNDRARGTIDHYLTRAVEKDQMSQADKDAAMGRLRLTTDLADVADCDLVIEAIVEELDAKRELFAELDRICRPDAILATNTSAIPVGQIAEATERPERVVGMHFFNPAPLLPLVEVIRAERSSDEAVEAAYAWAEQAGKQPVRCNDTPGFIVNRVLIPTLNECIRLLDEGVSPEDLDKAMTKGVGWPMGPCTLVDLVGIDIHIHAAEALHEATGDERAAPPERLREMAAEGKLGRKSGQGFFSYQ